MQHPQHEYARWKRALAQVPLPAACVDLDALEANVSAVRSAVQGRPVTIRVASKSVRHVGLLRRILAQGGGQFAGLMTFSAHEAVFLASEGFDDLLMGYPVGRWDEALALATLAAHGTQVVATVDGLPQVALLSRAAVEAGGELLVCLDLDASWRLLGGSLHLGVQRSPLRSIEGAQEVADAVAKAPGLRLHAVLSYEAQIAGMRDHNPTSRHLDPVRRLIRRRSQGPVQSFRARALEALRRQGHDIGLVNGGGTGSLGFTSQDPSVTEVTVGSGFLCPHLFDGAGDLALRPAAFFALGVVRRPDAAHVTCAGGGFIASGQVGADRSPIVHLPKGLQPTGNEGWGEVQTPFALSGGARLEVGDPVVCRHAKAGELAERFASYALVRADKVEATEPTYRGMGQCFF